MDAKTRLRLREDVAILPVAEIDPKQRMQLDCSPDAFVISQLRGRTTSKLIDPSAAKLLASFDPPCSLTEAVLRFCEASQDPPAVLEDAFPLIESLVRQNILVDAESLDSLSPHTQTFQAGESFSGWTIVRSLQVLDGCELYQVRRGSQWAALKLHRSADPGAEAAGSLAHEAKILAHLEGQIAPETLDVGENEAFHYLLLEWCHGLEAQAASREWRQRRASGDRLLTLCQNIARAYARLHQLGVLHGDVHPRNILIDRQGRVRLVDFGVAQIIDESEPQTQTTRPGVPFYYEPEHARSVLTEGRPAPLSEAGEQFAVGAVLYELVTGVHYCDFALGARHLLRCIVEQPPMAFSSRKLLPWPALESVLHRALSKDPAGRYASMAEFANALKALDSPDSGKAAPAFEPSRRLGTFLEQMKASATLDGPWLSADLESQTAPSVSIAYGAAGVALALLRISFQQEDPALLALSDFWCRRAKRAAGEATGISNRARDTILEALGHITPFHRVSGLHALTAMIASARADPWELSTSVAAFVDTSQPTAEETSDVFTGLGGTLLLCSWLLELHRDPESDSAKRLLDLGHRTHDLLWHRLDRQPPIVELIGEPLGIAHGWAGFLYTTLEWSRIAKSSRPETFEDRIEELASLAIPVGHGRVWEWPAARPDYPASWCQGSAGQVFLWEQASKSLRQTRYEDLAIAAGEATWQAPETHPNLCCGLVGRAYALLRLFRMTGDYVWLDRAHELALRCADQWSSPVGGLPEENLFQGRIALAVLAADLVNPAEARFPFFEI